MLYIGNSSLKQKTNKTMERTNLKFAGALSILSLVTMAAFFFEIAATVVLSISIFFAGFIAFIAMMSTYHYCGYGYNSGRFWFVYSTVGGAIIIASIYGTGMQLINDHLAQSLMVGLFPTIVPVIGIFLGDCGRIIIKAEPSAI
jgi:hypothetical protein